MFSGIWNYTAIIASDDLDCSIGNVFNLPVQVSTSEIHVSSPCPSWGVRTLAICSARSMEGGKEDFEVKNSCRRRLSKEGRLPSEPIGRVLSMGCDLGCMKLIYSITIYSEFSSDHPKEDELKRKGEGAMGTLLASLKVRRPVQCVIGVALSQQSMEMSNKTWFPLYELRT